MLQYTDGNYGSGGHMSGVDWNNEVRPAAGGSRAADTALRPVGGQNAVRVGGLHMQNEISDETVESPLSGMDAYLGSLKNMLLRNRGNYIVATFLMGTQSMVSFEGVLYEVGNDFITIYQEGRDRYIVVDMYSLKYVEFYDNRQEQLCRTVLQNNGTWQQR